jgi:SPP1 gp7 family putative phage head morphogenesis protein
MKLFEFLRNDVKDDLEKDTMRLADIGAVSFSTGATDKNQSRTPHYEILKGIEMYELNPIVNSGLNQLCTFVIPNKKIKITSKDPASVEFLEEWHEQRRGILEEFKNIFLTFSMSGQGYIEKFYEKDEEGQSILDNVFSINDASRVYINPNDINGPTAFIYELPVGIKQFMYRGEWVNPGFHTVTYIKNYQFVFKKVYGFPIPGWKIGHLKHSWSRDNIYGRSPLISALDAHNVMGEIISSWDTISRTRQIDQKILTVDSMESGLEVPQSRLDDIAEELANNDKSYTLLNIPLKFSGQDISVSGRYDLMEGVFDIARRMLITSLLPNHLTPWSDSATTQGAEAAMPPLMARVKALQNELISFLNKEILDELRKSYNWLASDVSYYFDEPKIIDDSYYISKVTDLVNSEIITKEQAKNYLLRLGVLDEEVFSSADGDEGDDELAGKEHPREAKALKEVFTKKAFKEIKTFTGDTFEKFKRRLREQNPKLKTGGWEELKYQGVGGHDVRLVKAQDQVMLFDGYDIIETFSLTIINKDVYIKAFSDYIKRLRDSFEDFVDEETEQDRVIKELEAEVKKELDAQLKKVLKAIDEYSSKTEGFSEKFLGVGILPKLDDLFKGFNISIGKSVTQALNKLNLSIVDGEEDERLAPPEVRDYLGRKKKLLSDNIKTQINTTKDKMLADIKTTLSQGITAGQSVSDIKSNVKKSFNYADGVGYKFDRIIRTETNTASKLLKLQKYQRMGFETVMWVTRDDSKVRDDHKKMHRRVYKISDLLKSITNRDLQLFNCRCTVTPY